MSAISERAKQFAVEYREQCNRFGMAISTTQDGGLTIEAKGSNLSEKEVSEARNEWPCRDYFGDGKYVTPAELEASRLRRIAEQQETQDRQEFVRLKRKFQE